MNVDEIMRLCKANEELRERAEKAEAIIERHEEWIRLTTEERDKALENLDIVARDMALCIEAHKARAEKAEAALRSLVDMIDRAKSEEVFDEDKYGSDMRLTIHGDWFHITMREVREALAGKGK